MRIYENYNKKKSYICASCRCKNDNTPTNYDNKEFCTELCMTNYKIRQSGGVRS